MTDLYNSNKLYYVTIGKDGRYASANNYFHKRFSLVPGAENGTFSQIIFPGDLQLYKETAAGCLLNPGKRRNLLLRMLKWDNSICTVDWEFFARLDEGGRVAGVSGIGFDSTQAEADYLSVEMQLRSLRLLSDSSSDGILLLNRDYKIVSYNKPAENLSLELYKRQYATGDDFREYVREEARAYFYRQFDKALKGDMSEEVFEMGKKDGRKVYLKVQMTPVYDENEADVSGVAVITRDVTLMQNLNKRLDEVSALQSHQIRRPVANMLSLVSLLDDDKLDEGQKEYLQLLKVSINQLEEEIKCIVKTARAV